jgi:hypothetical protein
VILGPATWPPTFWESSAQIHWRFFTDGQGHRKVEMLPPEVMDVRPGDCMMTLRALLRANGLLDPAFLSPPESRLHPSDDYDHMRDEFVDDFDIEEP